MKNDYLWDKSGEDAEIQKLETALAAFRFRAASPDDAEISASPSAPRAIVADRAETFSLRRFFSRRIFPFRLAAGAGGVCAASLIIAFGVWLQTSSDEPANVGEQAVVVASVKNADSPVATDSKNPVAPPLGEFENHPKAAERKSIFRSSAEHRRVVAAGFATREKTKDVKSAPAKIQLTDEERYAYEQLKIALSFASEKLKLVKDKAESAPEELGADLENGR